jgi:diguanylate cyclase (GGDEF)-like protein
MTKMTYTLSSGRTDSRVLRVLLVGIYVCLGGVTLFAATMACAWLIPAVGNHMPDHWKAMKFNIALCDLLAVASLVLQQPRRSETLQRVGRGLAVVIILITLAVLYQYATGSKIGVDTLFVSDALSGHPGRISQQSSYAFLLLGLILLFIRARKSVLSYGVDGLTFILMLMMFTYVFGYLYGVVHLFQLTMENRIGPLTVAGLFPLTMVVFAVRVPQGIFSVLVSDSIAGKTARLATPFTVGLPFLLAVSGVLLAKASIMQSEYASALATAMVALLAFALILGMTRRIQLLEREIHDLSLRDELTGLYNRRGFYVLAAQAFRLAQRSKTPFSILFLDMDGLKLVNDTLGHETGSALLKEMASVLAVQFRETDVVGRLGGDEFVMAGNADTEDMARAVERLKIATEEANAATNRAYVMTYSHGVVTADMTRRETLDDLLSAADRMMYQVKREKRGMARLSVV